MNKEEYRQKLLDPRWQKKRLQILERDDWTCQICYDTESTLHVHHRLYIAGADPWDYPAEYLVVLCEGCHEIEGQRMHLASRQVVDALKLAGCSSGDLLALARDLRAGLPWPHLPDVVTSVLCAVVADRETMRTLLDWYFESLHANQTLPLTWERKAEVAA